MMLIRKVQVIGNEVFSVKWKFFINIKYLKKDIVFSQTTFLINLEIFLYTATPSPQFIFEISWILAFMTTSIFTDGYPILWFKEDVPEGMGWAVWMKSFHLSLIRIPLWQEPLDGLQQGHTQRAVKSSSCWMRRPTWMEGTPIWASHQK